MAKKRKETVVTTIKGTCPKGHALTIIDDGEFLWGDCGDCGESWRVMLSGEIIPHDHPLGG